MSNLVHRIINSIFDISAKIFLEFEHEHAESFAYSVSPRLEKVPSNQLDRYYDGIG